MKIKNFTPHAINIMDNENNIVLTIPSSGIARCETTRTKVGAISGIPVNETKFGQLIGLPEPEGGTIFVVSAITAQAAKANGRTDCVIVDDAVRDESGRIIGARAFARV